MQHFLDTYQRLNADNLDLLQSVYSEGVHFMDPAHEIIGLDRLTQYFQNLYTHISAINFDFDHTCQSGNDGYVQWLMTFAHPKLNSGRGITIAGTSFVRFDSDEKIYYHRDYFDLGAMLYEHLPLLGKVIRTVKKRLGT